MRKRPLLLSACVFLAGLACEKYQTALPFAAVLVFLFQEAVYGLRFRRWKALLLRTLLLSAVCCLGMLHMQHAQAVRNVYLSEFRDGDTVTIWGEVLSVQTAEYGDRCIFTDCYIRIREEKVPCDKIMVYTSSYHFQVGEIHEITGQFQNFASAANPGNFDSRQYYQSQKIDFIVKEENSRLLGKRQNFLQEYLLSLKEKWKNVYENSMEEKAAGFYSAMLLGDKSHLSDTTKALFAIGGISHILAISGLHMSMVGRRVYQLLRKCGLAFIPAGMSAGLLVVSYCFMTGNGMSAVRAVGMLLLFFLAQCLGRSSDMLNSLGAVCLLLLWENPFLLEYSGFWFSVMALMGIGFVGTPLAAQAAAAKSFWMSMGITLATLPVSACNYYELSLYAPLVNSIVLPLLTPVFLWAMAGGLLGLWLPGAAEILLRPCAWAFTFYEWLCERVGNLPFAVPVCAAPTQLRLLVYYLVLAAFLFLLARWQNKLLLPVISIACFVLLLYPKPAVFEITFLDVGQGDGIYIRMEDGTVCFIDGGSSSVDAVGTYRILPFLKYKGVSAVDYWFVTHADSDHISGVIELLEAGYPVKHLLLSYAALPDENLTALLAAAETNQTEIIYMKCGDSIAAETAVLRCLSPEKESISDKNEASLVLALDVFEKQERKVRLKAIFTGDISAEREQYLLEQGLLEEVDIYKTAHHGSKYSSSEAFLQVLRPKISVISCSAQNRYGHPHAETLLRLEAVGSRIFLTSEAGAVTIQWKEQLEVLTQAAGRQ